MRGMMGGGGGFLGSMLFGGMGGHGLRREMRRGGVGVDMWVGLAFLAYRYQRGRRNRRPVAGGLTIPGRTRRRRPTPTRPARIPQTGSSTSAGWPPRREDVRGNGVGRILPAAGRVDAPGPVAGVGPADRRDARHLLADADALKAKEFNRLGTPPSATSRSRGSGGGGFVTVLSRRTCGLLHARTLSGRRRPSSSRSLDSPPVVRGRGASPDRVAPSSFGAGRVDGSLIRSPDPVFDTSFLNYDPGDRRIPSISS